MRVKAQYSLLIPGKPGTYAEVAQKKTEFDAAGIAEVAARCKDWIALNRAGNAEHPLLRFRAVANLGDGKIWSHDETRGDPLVPPLAPRRVITLKRKA